MSVCFDKCPNCKTDLNYLRNNIKVKAIKLIHILSNLLHLVVDNVYAIRKHILVSSAVCLCSGRCVNAQDSLN